MEDLKPKFKLGQIVFLITDTDQESRMVTAYTVRVTQVSYELSFGITTSWHNELEIATEINFLTKVK